MIKKYTLNNLDCANCAQKIEDAVRKVSGVRSVSVNFASKIIAFDADDTDAVKKAVKLSEPDVEMVEQLNAKSGQNFTAKKELFLISVSLAFFCAAQYVDYTGFAGIKFLPLMLFIVSYLISGLSVILRAVRNIFKGDLFDENFLMTLSTAGAFAIGAYAEGAAVMIFYQIGEFFQDLSVERSRKQIRSLLEIKAETARLVIGGEIKIISSETVVPGDILLVKPGERIPVDAVIIEGSSTLDTSALTGESLPRDVAMGDNVLSGSINLHGLISIKALKPLSESQASRILSLVEDASLRKAKTERFITTFARYYTPAVVVSACLVAFIPPLLIANAHFSEWIYRALVLLVISCPCALVVSIPLGYFGGIGGASRKGILVKGSQSLDALASVTNIVFDKTGTLTKGVFSVAEFKVENGFSEDEVLRYTAEAELHSNHPLAFSIRSAYDGNILNSDVEDYREIAGFGVKARVNGKELIAGNDKFMHLENIPHPTCETGSTTIHIAVDGLYAGHILLSDTPKEDAAKTVADLKNENITVAMLTGDSSSAASFVAKELGIDTYSAELLPGDKVSALEKMMAENKRGKTAFVGDGINDAPVIARADVGIAMGYGSDAAIETADIVIMSDSTSKIPAAIKHAKKTKSIVMQNIVFALGVKGFFAVLGIAGIATMWEAVFADVGVALLAVMNAMRAVR